MPNPNRRPLGNMPDGLGAVRGNMPDGMGAYRGNMPDPDLPPAEFDFDRNPLLAKAFKPKKKPAQYLAQLKLNGER